MTNVWHPRQALVQLLTLNMETELDLITSAAWAVNNLAHKSEENVDLIIRSGGVQLLLRIVGHAEVRCTQLRSVPFSRLTWLPCSRTPRNRLSRDCTLPLALKASRAFPQVAGQHCREPCSFHSGRGP